MKTTHITALFLVYFFAIVVSTLFSGCYEGKSLSDQPTAGDPIDPAPAAAQTIIKFFDAPNAVSARLASPAVVSKALTAEAPEVLPTVTSGKLVSWFQPVDDGDGDPNTYALDLMVDGVENFPDGYSAFQIVDIRLPACTEIVSVTEGSMLGPHVYPFQSYAVIASQYHAAHPGAQKKNYTARFGGYGSVKYALKDSGTLYRMFFRGLCGSGEISLVDYRFNRWQAVLPMEGSPVHEF